MIGQSRRHSAVEACANTAIGYAVAVAAQAAIFPAFNIHIPLSDNLAIGMLFTVVSLIRGYCLRRMFEAWSRA